MTSPWRLKILMACWLVVAAAPVASLWGQANIPQWSPHRPAPRPLAETSPLVPLPMHQPSGHPQWVLVRNPDLSTGLPPYALADSTGKLVRYVEPSAGIPIESYLGQVVEVRHDTGKTLLSSQLVVIGPQATTPTAGVVLADFRQPTTPPQGNFDGPQRPLDRAESMAQQLLGDRPPVNDRGPMQSLFEWAGGKRLGRFISVGEPREEFTGPAQQQTPSIGAIRHATASPTMAPPIRW